LYEQVPSEEQALFTIRLVDAKPGAENQIHELNSEFIGPFVCVSQL
jgi:hypothetical protein